MGKHSAEKYVQKNKKIRNENKKRGNWGKIIFIIFIFIIAIFLIEFVYKHDFFDTTTESAEEQSKKITREVSNSVPLSSILPDSNTDSSFESKLFSNTNLRLTNLLLNYKNNITAITFDILNESSKIQDIFNFTFSLLDSDDNVIISYDLSSKEVIDSNQKKNFVLIATRDVTHATDFKISIKK